MVKGPPANAGNTGLILGSGGFPGEENGYPLHYSYLENPMDRGAWWATVRGVTKSQRQLSMYTRKELRSHKPHSTSKTNKQKTEIKPKKEVKRDK